VCVQYRLGYVNRSGKCPEEQASPCPAQESSLASPRGAFLAAATGHEVLSNPGASKLGLLHHCFVF